MTNKSIINQNTYPLYAYFDPSNKKQYNIDTFFYTNNMPGTKSKIFVSNIDDGKLFNLLTTSKIDMKDIGSKLIQQPEWYIKGKLYSDVIDIDFTSKKALNISEKYIEQCIIETRKFILNSTIDRFKKLKEDISKIPRDTYYGFIVDINPVTNKLSRLIHITKIKFKNINNIQLIEHDTPEHANMINQQ